jgi:hypothetical protein
VRDDLSGLLDRHEIEAEVRTVAQEVLEAIDNFVLATAVPGIEAKLESLPAELSWGYRVLALLGPALAEALLGGALKHSFTLGKKHVYVGCNVYFTTPEGERCLWLQVSPADGSGYGVPGLPVCLWVVEQKDSGPWPIEIRKQAVAAGFEEETDDQNYKALRRGYPMDQLVLLGDEAAQAGWLLGELFPILTA